MEQLCTCLVPAYNEGVRAVNVLKTLVQITEFQSIILIDDGSDEQHLRIYKAYIDTVPTKNIHLISYPQNKGKSHAIKMGLELVQTPYVFLCDADLIDIDLDEIKYMIHGMYAHPEIDMAILRRIFAKWYIKLFYRELVLSGQRMLKTVHLINVFERKIEKYQLEIAINSYMGKHKKIVVWYPFSADHLFKYKKRGFWSGWFKDALMYRDMFVYHGCICFVRHTLLFKPSGMHEYLSKK